jgi:beta-ureidopropionase / N-carbamoyl-L-amino-acid hydrolase
MIFTPCRAGKSHAPQEWADRDALAAGASVMFETVRALDQAG